MPGSNRKKELFDRIVRLRRAERDLPANHDVSSVRAELEAELGGSVSRSLAASWLGVSHTALNRWVAAGDVPVVIAESGRREISVATVAELFEAVQQEREAGRRHALEPSMLEGRSRAARLDPRRLLTESTDQADRHRVSELRSLVYHRALARRLRKSDVHEARRRLWQWNESGAIDPRYVDRWQTVLDLPVKDVKRIIAADDQEGRDLRQNSPFAGALTEPERQRILREVP